MKKYDLIVIGTGSGMNFIDSIIESKQDIKIAVIDKDEPGGICLTRGCIPSKLLLYPAELVRMIGKSGKFGIDAAIKNIDFMEIMERMRNIIHDDIENIRMGLSASPNIDYYHDSAEFVSPYTIKTGKETLSSKMIFLCTGSKVKIPHIIGLEDAGYLTSDTVLEMTQLPESIVIIGGGYIATEYGHFFSSMGSSVTIIGRNNRLIPQEEPEISGFAKMELSKHMNILTGYEVLKVQRTGDGKKVIARDRSTGHETYVVAEEILVASGREPNTDILVPEKGGIEIDKNGWITVNDYMETSQPNIWAFGDANGKYLFKHVANHESRIVYSNAILKNNIKADYHAVPHAVFSYPEIASVGMKEKEAISEHGEENVLIGFKKYGETAKGIAMDAMDYFVKVIVERGSYRLLGAHIIGPHASILIHEIIPLMYTRDQSAEPIIYGMHIHPALNEVVQRAFHSLMPPAQYHHILKHLRLEQE
ncbi:MAG: dihydrolipoyl dehydrogenase [Candidatus Methanoperedens sp.]|nr:dihydrolipoyl dehydrogenase [Candidatus Methanoperedens sp.]